MVKAAPSKYFQTDAQGILDWTEEKTKKETSLLEKRDEGTYL